MISFVKQWREREFLHIQKIENHIQELREKKLPFDFWKEMIFFSLHDIARYEKDIMEYEDRLVEG